MWKIESPLQLTGLACLAFVSVTSTAAAADSETQRARALFDEAGQLEREGRWSAAQEKLRGALRLRDTPNLHYALGWALENDDKLLEAKGEYEAALRLARERPGNDEAARLAAARLADLDKKIPVIRVRVTGPARTTARVVLDGVEIKQDTPVNPGSHFVRVERGEGPSEQMVYVGRGVSRTVEVEARTVRLEPAIAVATAPASEREPVRLTAADVRAETAATRTGAPRSRQNVVPWLLTTGGVVAVVGGAGLLASSATDSSGAEARQGFGLGLGGLGFVAIGIGAAMLLRSEPKPVLVRF